MYTFLGLLCFVGVSAVSAEKYVIFDTEITPVKDAKCPDTCIDTRKAVLQGISRVINWVLPELDFSTGFCNASGTGLGNFEVTYDCNTNSEFTIFDHTISLKFKEPVGTLYCSLPYSPAGAANKINNAYLPKNKYGKNKDIEDKTELPKLNCDGDASDAADKPSTIKVDFPDLIWDIVLRIDAQDTDQDYVYPLYFAMTTSQKNPATLQEGEGFKEAFDCITNDENINSLLKRMFTYTLTAVFKCLDENNKDPYIHLALSYFGHCRK